MRNKIIYLLIGVLAETLTFCSCNSDERESDIGISPLKISTNINSRSIVSGTSFINGDQVGVFVLNPQGNAYDAGSLNLRGLYSTQWSFPDLTLYLTSKKAAVYAYYPYVQGNDSTKISVKISDQTDYLYGCSTDSVNNSSSTANIQFKHALARVTISLIRDSNDKGTGLLKSVTLRNTPNNTDISVLGVLDIKTGNIVPVIDAKASLMLFPNDVISNSTATNIDILVIPTTVNYNAEAVMDIDGKYYSFKIPKTNWEAGKQYTYPITINRTE